MNAFALPHRDHGWRSPGYARAVDCIDAALPAIAPIKRMTVSQWAAAERKLLDNGSVVSWRNEVVPYMVEPMDMLSSRRFRGLAFVGPARTGKTDGLIINKIGQGIVCDPSDMRVIHMDQAAAREFSIKKVSNLIRYSPTVADRQASGRNADNIYDKRFLGNMILDIGWPVIAKFSASDIPVMLLTDYDRMPDDISGEGSGFELAMKRTQTFGSRGMAAAESSPGRLLLDEDWKPSKSTPHMAPPTTGILEIYNKGTRGRFYWTCLDCSEQFEPDFNLLDYPDEGTPAERGAQTVMNCPHCGTVIEPKQKRDFNLAGQWLHETNDGRLVPIDDDDVRDTDIVSYWIKGAVAAFQSWPSLVTKYEAAIEGFERNGDETSLKTTTNVDQGHPYKPRSLGSGSDISAEGLKDKSGDYEIAVAPVETRFVTVQVDVQKRYFVVQVDAWGPDLERWMIDRFEIHTPPASAPNAEKRAIDPARYGEDWDALFDLLDKVYPVADTGYGVKPAAMIVDTGGEAGVTKNAYAFYRKSKRKGLIRRVFLAKGQPGWKVDRAKEVEPEKVEGKRVKGKTDLRIVRIGTWRLKQEIVGSLSRKDPGASAYHLSSQFPAPVFEEMCAERQTVNGWELRQGQKRNEAFDCSVYGLALVIVLKAETFDWDKPPLWAAPIAENSFAVLLDAAEEHEPEPVVAPKPRRRRMLSRGI